MALSDCSSIARNEVLDTMKQALLVLLTAAATTGFATPVMADAALAKARNCMACHAAARKLVGPSYKDVAARYAGDGSAADRLAGKIMHGSAGTWGAVPMPANPGVSEADAKRLAEWILNAN